MTFLIGIIIVLWIISHLLIIQYLYERKGDTTPNRPRNLLRCIQWEPWQTLYSLAPKSLQTVIEVMKLKTFAPWKKSYDQPRQHIKKQRHYFVNKGPYSESYRFSSSHVQMWELDNKNTALKNWFLWTVGQENTLENPLDNKIKPLNPKGNQPWIFIGRTDVEAEITIFWPPDVKSQLIGKGPDAGKDWRQEDKGTTEDEMLGWHHQLNGYEFE